MQRARCYFARAKMNLHAFFDIFLPKSMKNKHYKKDSIHGAHWMIPGARHAYQWILYEKKIQFALSLSLLAQKLAKIAILEVSCEILEFENSKKTHFSKSGFFMMFFRHHMVNKCCLEVHRHWISGKFEKIAQTEINSWSSNVDQEVNKYCMLRKFSKKRQSNQLCKSRSKMELSGSLCYESGG